MSMNFEPMAKNLKKFQDKINVLFTDKKKEFVEQKESIAKRDAEGYDPYCSLCESCGEEGCCSHINCFRKLIKNSNCAYGERYLKDALFDKRVASLGHEIICNIENGLFTSELAISEWDKRWNEIYDEVYN